MPIHGDWVSMIRAMNKEYPTGKVKCYPKAGGGKVCAHAKAWSVFYKKVNKEFGARAYMKPRTRKKKKAQESEEQDVEEMKDELERDIYLDWLDEVYELDKK